MGSVANFQDLSDRFRFREINIVKKADLVSLLIYQKQQHSGGQPGSVEATFLIPISEFWRPLAQMGPY